MPKMTKHCQNIAKSVSTRSRVPRWCCNEFHNLLWGSWTCIQARVLKPGGFFWAQHCHSKIKLSPGPYTCDKIFPQSLMLWEAVQSECHCNVLTIRYNPFSDAMCFWAGWSHFDFAKNSQWLRLEVCTVKHFLNVVGWKRGLEGQGLMESMTSSKLGRE